MSAKIANQLLKQRDPHTRNRMIVMYSIILTAAMIAMLLSVRSSSPLKVIPQTVFAIFVGGLSICIGALQQFPKTAEFIDWNKVEQSAELADAKVD